MSTKIYKAYKLKRNEDLWTLIRDLRKRGVEEVKKVVTDLTISIMSNVDLKSSDYLEALAEGLSDNKARFREAARTIRNEYYKQLTSPYRNEFDFNTSVRLRECEGSYYLIPYCDMLVRHTLDFLDTDERLEDFAYWNNTDHPEHITESEWEARREVWNKIYEAGWDNALSLEIVGDDNFYKVCPTYRDIDEKMQEAFSDNQL